MKNKSLVVGILAGALGGIALVVACSDDSPTRVDAATTCDCPAAEPPLAGRITSVRVAGPLTPGATGVAFANCPVGATILGGACEVTTPDALIQVMSSKFERAGGQGFLCRWTAVDATVANTGTAEAICLLPAT
jgi:hypothetical protein